jgi:hypothetical protein
MAQEPVATLQEIGWMHLIYSPTNATVPNIEVRIISHASIERPRSRPAHGTRQYDIMSMCCTEQCSYLIMSDVSISMWPEQVSYDVVADNVTMTVHETDPYMGDIMLPLPIGEDGYTDMEDALADVMSLAIAPATFIERKAV